VSDRAERRRLERQAENDRRSIQRESERPWLLARVGVESSEVVVGRLMADKRCTSAIRRPILRDKPGSSRRRQPLVGHGSDPEVQSAHSVISRQYLDTSCKGDGPPEDQALDGAVMQSYCSLYVEYL